MATKKIVRRIRVKVLQDTVIGGAWLQEGDVYEGTAEEVQPAMDNGYVEAVEEAAASTDEGASTLSDAAPAAGG